MASYSRANVKSVANLAKERHIYVENHQKKRKQKRQQEQKTLIQRRMKKLWKIGHTDVGFWAKKGK